MPSLPPSAYPALPSQACVCVQLQPPGTSHYYMFQLFTGPGTYFWSLHVLLTSKSLQKKWVRHYEKSANKETIVHNPVLFRRGMSASKVRASAFEPPFASQTPTGTRPATQSLYCTSLPRVKLLKPERATHSRKGMRWPGLKKPSRAR
jgi:hypothetical protein